MKIELVTWIDAESPSNEWKSVEDSIKEAKEDLPTVHTVGFVLFENKRHISLIHTDGHNEHIHAIKIPKRWIIKRRILAKRT